MHLFELAADALTELNPDAVIASGAERQARNKLGNVLGDHLAIEDEAAGTENEPPAAADAFRL